MAANEVVKRNISGMQVIKTLQILLHRRGYYVTDKNTFK